MWHWAFELSRVRKARKAAVTVLSPIVEKSRHRLGGISEVTWSDPYMIGFMVMLISIIARIESGKIAGNSMSLVQCRAWEDITRMRSDMMAEELLLLSTARNRDFELGCHNAATLGSILFGSPILSEGAGVPREDRPRDLPELELTEPFAQRDDVSVVWVSFFDASASRRFWPASPVTPRRGEGKPAHIRHFFQWFQICARVSRTSIVGLTTELECAVLKQMWTFLGT